MGAHFGGLSPVRQQRTKSVVIIGAAVIVLCLAIAGFLFVNSSSSTASVPDHQIQVKEVPAQIEMIDVLVPIQNVDAGVELKPSMFKKEPRPKSGLPTRAVRDFEEIKNFYSRSLIPADTVLVADLITTIRPSSIITTQIPEGYRAVTIRVDMSSGVEGW